MGLRVRAVLVVLSLLAVAALAVPLALSLADRRTAALAAERDRQLAALADAAAMPGRPAAAPGRPLSRGVRGRPAHHRLRRPNAGRARTRASRTRRRDGGRTTPSSTHPRRSGRRSCRGTDTGSWPPRVSDSDGELVGAVVLAVDTSGRSARYRDGLAVGGGRLSGPARRWPRWSPVRSPGGCCARSTGSSARSPR